MILIAKKTAAVAASAATEFKISGSVEYATISADALSGAERVDIFYRADASLDFAPVDITLTANAPQVDVTARGAYRVAKDATASACAVAIMYKDRLSM